MNIIVAVDENLGIGYNGDLLYHLSNDLKNFKQLTTGKVVVMGKKTFLSLPKRPLPNRTNIVLTTSGQQFDGAITCKNKQELFKELQKYNINDIFIIGGASIYSMLAPYCKKAYITKIHATAEADTFFENFDAMPNWKLVSASVTMQEGDLEYEFLTYENSQVKSIKPTDYEQRAF